MVKSILITGVGGSGKSCVCYELTKRGYNAYSIEDIRGICYTSHKETGEDFKDYDNDDFEKVKKMDWLCDKNKLEKLMDENKEGVVFYCGITSNLKDLLHLFDTVFILQVSPEVLCKRLSQRGKGCFARTPEVQKWLLSWKDNWEKSMLENGAIGILADENLQNVVDKILEKVFH